MSEEPKSALLLHTCLGLYMALLFGGLLAALVALWPVPPDGHAVSPHTDLPLELRYLLIVAVTGAIGSYIHLATSFADHSGTRRLAGSWTWWYLLRPFIGAFLALLLYFTVRGGLIQGDDEHATASVSPYGLAALAGMSGLFSRHATEKLREVFENLFRTGQNGPPRNPSTPPPAAAEPKQPEPSAPEPGNDAGD